MKRQQYKTATARCLMSAFFAVILLSPASHIVGQEMRKTDGGCNYLKEDRPSIFISYERETAGENAKGHNIRQMILRLHNNSTCTIVIETDDMIGNEKLFKKEVSRAPNGDIMTKYIPDPPEGALLSIFYDIQEARNKAWKPANYWEGRDLVFTYTVPSGHSVTFPVKEKYFKRKYLISVPFSYAWEDNHELSTLGTINHRVFYVYELPEGFYKG
jgi:hypothetical protein